MIPTSVFLARYTPETVSKASSLIEIAGEVANLPGGDGLARWAKALDWVCTHAGGVDRSTAVRNDLLDRLIGFRKHDIETDCGYPDKLIQEIIGYVESLSAELLSKTQELTELRAQMLSDRGQKMGDWLTQLLRWDGNDCVLDLGALGRPAVGMVRYDGQSFGWVIGEKRSWNTGWSNGEARDCVEKAVRAALGQSEAGKDSLTTAPAETPRTCETCRHSPDGEPVPASDRCSICRAAHGLPHWTERPNEIEGIHHG